jgi:glycosyltransferase involved in cell wall biosynthesis
LDAVIHNIKSGYTNRCPISDVCSIYSHKGYNKRTNSRENMKVHISVVIPAHNEEKYIKRCIDSIKYADSVFPGNTEIVVVCNRCTDHTADIAKENGAVVRFNEDRCIAKVRNDGISVAKGKIIVTIDADNRMTKGTLREIYSLLRTGKYIGGGAPIRFERYSFPLWCNDIVCRVSFAVTGLYSGIFWAEKETFDRIGGFADKKAMEDVATAKLLREYGKKNGKQYTTLRKNYLINSTRKYDDLGDWLYFKLIFKNLGTLLKAVLGDRSGLDKLLDNMFYDYNDNHK